VRDHSLPFHHHRSHHYALGLQPAFPLPYHPLKRDTQQKIGILTLGNIIGLFWSFVLNQFAIACNIFFGEPFSIFYAIAYPFLNFMWIVSFWSLSLAFLPKPKGAQTEVKP